MSALSALACCLAFAANGCRQEPPLTADAVLARARMAVHPAGVPTPRTMVISGTSAYRGQNGQQGVAPLYQHWREPGVFYQELTAPFGVVQRWFDGRRGWTNRPELPNRTLPDAELAEARRDAALYQPWALIDEYSALTYEGRRTDGSGAYDVVAGRSTFGKTERFWFDPVTGRVKYLEVWEQGPEGLREPGGAYYQSRYVVDGYRPVGGMMLPHHVQRIRPNSSFDIRFASIQVDVPVDTIRERPALAKPVADRAVQ